MGDGWLSVSEVAGRYGVTGTTVRRWCVSGLLPNARKFGDGRTAPWVIPEADLAGFEPPKIGRLRKKQD